MYTEESIPKMLCDSRYASGKSQAFVAEALGVSKKTIQNWESGYKQPNLEKLFMWFDAIGVPMYPYLMEAIYPDEMAQVTANIDMNEVRELLHHYVDELDDLHTRELLYLLYGSHGSSPTGTLDVITAYLHMPLAMKVSINDLIISNYEISTAVGLTHDDEHVVPKIETMKKYVNSARQAVLNGKQTYTIVEDHE